MLGEVYQANYIYGRYEFRINICRFTYSEVIFYKILQDFYRTNVEFVGWTL